MKKMKKKSRKKMYVSHDLSKYSHESIHSSELIAFEILCLLASLYKLGFF